MKRGDRVVCIKDYSTRAGRLLIKKGTIHLVVDIFRCSCGNWAYVFAYPADYETASCKCGMRHKTHGLFVVNKDHFVPVDWDDCRHELIYEAMQVKKEEFEIILE
jgi:hypothetical protein